MLVLARKVGERILIGDQIAVTVVKVGPGGVRIGIEAPPELAVVREELAEQIAAEIAGANETDPELLPIEASKRTALQQAMDANNGNPTSVKRPK